MESITIEKQYRIEHDEFDWRPVISSFQLDDRYTHLGSSQFLASHATPVRHAISSYSQALDKNPVKYTIDHEQAAMQLVRTALNDYFNVGDPDDIAVTDSTTMGLGLLYTALNIGHGHEILTTEHDHYSAFRNNRTEPITTATVHFLGLIGHNCRFKAYL